MRFGGNCLAQLFVILLALSFLCFLIRSEMLDELAKEKRTVLHAEQQGIARSRIEARVLDATDPSAAPLCDACADAALLVFTLSAVQPAHMATVLRLAYESLRPGGVLLFRDYAEVRASWPQHTTCDACTIACWRGIAECHARAGAPKSIVTEASC